MMLWMHYIRKVGKKQHETQKNLQIVLDNLQIVEYGKSERGEKMNYSVKQARQLAGLTQCQMAQKMRIHRDTYRKIEGNPETATIAQGRIIAQITGIPFDSIFFSSAST